MSRAASAFPYSAAPHVGPFSSLALAGLVLAASVISGCASKSTTADGRPAPGSQPYSSDRDGAPSDAPPNLANLPDAVPQVEPIKVGGPNKPYKVLGQSYEPIAKDVSWKEKGLASWYGTKFHGRRTASGEMFSMYALTAAHRTLPIPSYARVRHAKSGKEVIVRINDRGPFHSSRVIDLSYAAAVKLGMVSAGSATVEIERLTFDEIRTGAWKRGSALNVDTDMASAAPLPESAAVDVKPLASVMQPAAQSEVGAATALEMDARMAAKAPSGPPPLVKVGSARAHTAAAKGFWVQLAAMGKRDSVDKLYQKVSTALVDLSPLLAVFQEASHFKLQAGPYESRREALAVAEQARDALQLTPMVLERR